MLVEPPPVDKPALVDRPAPAVRVGRAATLRASFGYAFEGLFYMLRTQRNAQIHLGFACAMVGLGLFFGLARWEWVSLILICALVLAAEGINTALEAVVDLASPQYHPLAKIAKDVAAGTVLLTALAAVLIGLLLFLPHLWLLWLALRG